MKFISIAVVVIKFDPANIGTPIYKVFELGHSISHKIACAPS